MARRIPKALFGGDSGGRIMNDWVDGQLREVDRSKPLFLFMNYLECHWSYAPPRHFAKRVGGPRFGPLEGLRYRTGVAAKAGPWEAIARAKGDQRRLDVLSTLYDGELANADDHLRGLIEVMRARGFLGSRPTLIVVTSDHGEHLGEHGLADHHAALCEHLTRVPFVAWGPGLVPSGVRGRLYELVDVFPSIVRLLGEEQPAGHLAGRRDDLFAPETKTFGEEYAVTEWKAWVDKERDRLAARNPSFDFTGLARDLVAVRDRRFKLVREPDGDRLFDLPADPLEEHDLGRSRPETSRRLRERLDGVLESWRTWEETGVAEITPEEREEIEQRLEELGYI